MPKQKSYKGRVVKIKTGKIGYALYSDQPVNGKVVVRLVENDALTGENLLCSSENLTHIGFID